MCAVCEQNKWRVFYGKTAAGKVLHCHKCGFLCVDKPPAEAVILRSGDTMTQEITVNQEYYLDAMSGKLVDAKIRLQDMENVIGRKHLLLDVGCYIGIFLHVAQTAGWAVQGIEPIKVAAKWGEHHFSVPIKSSTLTEAPWPDNYFEAVTSFEVIEHIVDPRRELEEMVRVLKPSGYLVVETPNADSWLAVLSGRRWRQWIPGHVSLFTPKTLTQICESLGLHIVKIKRGKAKAASLGLLAVTIRDRISRPLGTGFLQILRWLHLTDAVIILWLPDVFTLYAQKR